MKPVVFGGFAGVWVRLTDKSLPVCKVSDKESRTNTYVSISIDFSDLSDQNSRDRKE